MATATLPPYPPFDTEDEISSLPQKWEEWVDGLEDMMSALAITNHDRKWSMLKFYGGEKLRKLEKQLTYDKDERHDANPNADPPILGTRDHYRSLKNALSAHFAPCVNETYARFRFRSINQEDGESIDTFVTRLRTQATRCQFHADDLSSQVRDQIVFGCRSGKLRRKALAENLALDRLIQVARAEESARANAAEMEKANEQSTSDASGDVFKVSRSPGKYSNKLSLSSKPPAKIDEAPNPPKSDKKCFNCGGPFPHSKEKPCPAKGKSCNKCSKLNHFASQCRGGRGTLAAVAEYSSDDDVTASLGEIRHVGSLSGKPPLVDINSSVGQIRFNPDTGADVTLIDHSTYAGLQKQPALTRSNIKLMPYGAVRPLEILGHFDTTLHFQDKALKETVYVSRGSNKGVSLLSRSASRALGLVTLNFLELEPHCVSQLLPEGSNDHPLLRDFDDICEGVGCHKDLAISLPLREGATHTVAPPPRIPVNLLPKVKAEIDRLEAEGVFESVPVDDNVQSVSRLVPVPKRIEGSDEIGVRLTMDWRDLNRNLEQVHHAVPTVEQLKHDLNGAKVFSQLDLKDAFYQLPLDEASKKLTTFSTPWGLKRSTRLVQGARPSSAICHEVLRRDLQGISGALNIADNIMVWGRGATDAEAEKDHDRALKETFQMCRRTGLTLNRKKCIFSATSTKFFGYVFSADGVLPDPDKVTALRKAEPPKSKEEVRSFLGMAGFNAQFIPGYATMSAPLRDLTKKGVNFKWGKREQEAFSLITKAISENTLLSYFDPKRETALFTDASPVGVNATLAQKDDNGLYRPVNIASRALNNTEKEYDQLEREAMAMHFGCKRFKIFLQGCHFTHFIDPEPLKSMMEKSKKEAPARIEKVRLKLQGFSSTIQLIKGKHNPADYLSRHPLPYKTCSKEERQSFADVQNHLFLVAQMLPEAITITRVREATLKDPVLGKIVRLLRTGVRSCPSDADLRPFRAIWGELSLGIGVLLRGDRVVLPKGLVNDALRLAHEGHMGIQKTKQYLRACVWFPKMDGLVETLVNRCLPCQAVTSTKQREPLQMTPLPPEPWQLVAADIFGPLPSGEKVLVLKCLRSKWPEIGIFLRNQSTNADSVIAAMEKMFAVHGIPDVVRTDNGPPFNSKAFKQFSKKVGFQTQKVTPLWPEANGQAEAFMKCLGKIVRTAHIENRDWKVAVDRFLLAYRATPHPSTGVAPANLMFPGRRFKTLLPSSTSATASRAAVAKFNREAMQAAKAYADKRRRVAPSSLRTGDLVLVRQSKKNKLTPPFDPLPYRIVAIKGAMVTAERGGHTIVRNSSFFKSVPHSLAPMSPASSANRAAPTPASHGAASSGLPLFTPDPPLGANDADHTLLTAAPPRVAAAAPPAGNSEARRPLAPPPDPNDSGDDVFHDAEGGEGPVAADPQPPVGVFRPPANLEVPSQSFSLPRTLRLNAPPINLPYNLRSRTQQHTD